MRHSSPVKVLTEDFAVSFKSIESVGAIMEDETPGDSRPARMWKRIGRSSMQSGQISIQERRQ